MGKIIQNGVIYTGTGSGGGGGASSVDQLTDVQLTSPTTGDELVYNSSLTSPYKWENKKLTWTGTQAQYDLIATPDPDVTYFITDSDTGNYGLNDLADVTITSAADGQLLTYDSANSVWVNKKPNNLPIAYIRFTSTDAMSSWSETETVYNTVTITDEYGSSLIPANLINSNKELIYALQVEYIRLNSSDEIIARYVFRDIDAQNLSGSSIFLISCNMIWGEMRAFVNFIYAPTPTPRYEAKCYMLPITYDSKTAASGGTDLSLVTTGEKYNWNNKADSVTPPAEYDSTATYNIGDFVTYQGSVYICIYPITTAEAWNSAHWALVSPDTDYLHSINPNGYGSFSLNRRSGSTAGNCSFVEGYNCTASYPYSHAEGYNTTASSSGAHAEGWKSIASGNYSHAEGWDTVASGDNGSHAEGRHTIAGGVSSHAEGSNTTASGIFSHSEGLYTTANHKSQHVFGEYNIADPSSETSSNRGNYVEIVGNGTSNNATSNARTLDWDGNEVLAGGLKINSTQDVATQVSLTQAQYDNLVSGGTVDLVNTIYFITDADAVAGSAAEITYSNTTSGLTATNVQGAIDEVNSKIESVKDGVHTETLVAGQTTIKFYESSEIASTTLIELYADEFGVTPSNMEVVNNSGLSEYYVQVTFSSAFDHNISLMIKYSTNSTYDEV